MSIKSHSKLMVELSADNGHLTINTKPIKTLSSPERQVYFTMLHRYLLCSIARLGLPHIHIVVYGK